MVSFQQAYYFLLTRLNNIYPQGESAAIAHEVMNFITGRDKLDRIVHKDQLLTENQSLLLTNFERRLGNGEPLQHITREQWFFGQKMLVSADVLIPRPETEELVEWILADWKSREHVSILDVGTGSGCIAIALKMNIPGAVITACDLSEEALVIAQKNARFFETEVSFVCTDFLEEDQPELSQQKYDVLVSNPPYIPKGQAGNLAVQVRDFEPAQALFVPDENPFIFYSALARFGKSWLAEEGAIYCEIHSDFACETTGIFKKNGYECILKDDFSGNARMIKAKIATNPQS